MFRRYLLISLLLVVALAATGCDMVSGGVGATPTSGGGGSQLSRPVSQGWIVKLPALSKDNNYRAKFDVLSMGGWPIGSLSVEKGQSYEQHGSPELISTIRVATSDVDTATSSVVLELAASKTVTQTGATHIEEAQAGHVYEGTTAQGWQVRVTVREVSIDEHPKLPGGSTGPDPVFSSLDINVEVGGEEETPYVGITADAVTRLRAAAENLRGPDLEPLDHGVVVREVLPASPASIAGLQPNDVILALDGKPVDEFTSLSVLVGRYKVGDKVTLDVVRATRMLRVELTLKKHP